jgi:LacI family transcriptional regulator, galactose operon repressor
MSNTVKAKRVTLKAVAQAAGVSLPTASQILNNKANNYCSAEKKRLVRRVAKELNYQPNFGYKVMCGQKTNTIGLLCSSNKVIKEEYAKDLLLGLMTEFEQQGYSVYTSVLSNSAKDNALKIMSLINRGCSGFVLMGTPFGETEIENIFVKNNIDYVFYNTPFSDRKVIVDSSYAIECFINNFLKEGRDNFKLIISGDLNDAYSRGQGLINVLPDVPQKQLLEQYVIQLKSTTFTDIEYSFQLGYEQTKKLIERTPDTRGIIYHTDHFALGGAKYLSEKGYKIGEDIELCGYNNTDSVKVAPWPINTADHDNETTCKVITKQLFKQGPFEIILKPKVIFK